MLQWTSAQPLEAARPGRLLPRVLAMAPVSLAAGAGAVILLAWVPSSLAISRPLAGGMVPFTAGGLAAERGAA